MNNKLNHAILFIIEIIIVVIAFLLICKLFFEYVLQHPGSDTPYPNDFIYDAIVAAPVLICKVIWLCTSMIVRAIKSTKKSDDDKTDDK